MWIMFEVKAEETVEELGLVGLSVSDSHMRVVFSVPETAMMW